MKISVVVGIATAALVFPLAAVDVHAAQRKSDGRKTPPAPAGVTQEKSAHPARLEPFIGKWAAALQSAKARNAPILVHIILDGEAQNDEYRDKILPDKELVVASAGALVIIANNGTHARTTIERVVDGQPEKREVCAVYGSASCAEHQANWDDLYKTFREEDGQLHCPQTLVFAPDGTVTTRINTRSVPASTEILAALKAAQTKAGPGLTQAQLVEVERLLVEGRNLMSTKAWPDAWRTWQKVLAITLKSVYADEARRELANAQAAIAADLDAISAGLVPGRAAQGFQDLVDFESRIAGLPIEKEVQARIKKADADKALHDEIAAYKLSVEADALLREAQVEVDAKQDKKAEKKVRRLFAKRYAATPAAAKARALWPEWAADEASKTGGAK